MRTRQGLFCLALFGGAIHISTVDLMDVFELHSPTFHVISHSTFVGNAVKTLAGAVFIGCHTAFPRMGTRMHVYTDPHCKTESANVSFDNVFFFNNRVDEKFGTGGAVSSYVNTTFVDIVFKFNVG